MGGESRVMGKRIRWCALKKVDREFDSISNSHKK